MFGPCAHVAALGVTELSQKTRRGFPVIIASRPVIGRDRLCTNAIEKFAQRHSANVAPAPCGYHDLDPTSSGLKLDDFDDLTVIEESASHADTDMPAHDAA